MCYTKKKPLGNSEKMAGAVRPLVLPLPEVEAETMGWTKRNNPRPLRAAVTRANVKGILVCGNIGRRGSSGWRRPPHSGAGSGTSPRDSRLHVHLISPCTHKMCSDCVCSPSLRFRVFVRPDSRVCDEHLLETTFQRATPPRFAVRTCHSGDRRRGWLTCQCAKQAALFVHEQREIWG